MKRESKMSNVYIVMYHYVREIQRSRYNGIKGLEVSLFREQVKFLKQHFHIVTMEEVVAACKGEEELPERAAVLTFDDGYIDHYKYVFPILKNEKVQGSFFVPGKTFTEHKLLDVNKVHFILAAAQIETLIEELNRQLDYYRGSEWRIPSNEELFEKYAVANRWDTKETIYVKRCLQTALPEKLRNIISSNLFKEFVSDSEENFAYELYMNADQIRCMKNCGMHIGLHGYDHYWLGNLEEKSMQKDIDKSLEVLDEFIDCKNWVMNYPYGSFNENVVSYIEKKNCVLGLSTEVRIADLRKDNRYKLPRFDTNDFPPQSENYLNI